jgi:hypothetical protein
MRIINFGQVVDLEHGTRITHQLTVETEPGIRLQVITDEGTVQQLVDALVGVEESPIQHEIPEAALEQSAGDVFGGEYDPGELVSLDTPSDQESVMGALTAEHVTFQRAPGGIGQPAKRLPVDGDGFYLPVKAKTVPKDEMGYPVVPRVAVPTGIPDDGETDGTQI